MSNSLNGVKSKARAADLAAALRSGKTIEQVGDEFDLAPSTVRSRVVRAGWTTNGELRKAR